MRYVLKHDLVLDRPFLRRVHQMYLGTHFIFRETTLMLLSIAGAVMRKPITFQTPAPLYNGFPEGSVGVRGWLHALLIKMCATPASDKTRGLY